VEENKKNYMSNVIVIKPRPLLTNHPIEIKMQAVRSLSSFFKGGFPYNPLSKEQILEWMPELLNMEVTEKGFRAAVENYFIEITIPIPFAGKELQIGLYNGQPINVEDYIKYLFAKGSKRVASNEVAFRSDAMYEFYIDDPKDAEKQRQISYNSTLEASLLLAELDKNSEKAAYVLSVLNPDMIVHNMTIGNIKLELGDWVRLDPVKFTTTAKAHNLKDMAFINSLGATGIVTKIGESYIYQDITLGNKLNEVVAYINSPANSAVVNQMKAKIKQIEVSSQIVNEEDGNPEDAYTAAPTTKASSK